MNDELIIKENFEEEAYDTDQLIDIKSWGKDLTCRELVNMFNEKEIIIPDIQRYYVWDPVTASRLIESILLDLPIPSLFFAMTEQKTSIVIDGLQRILTIVSFIEGKEIQPNANCSRMSSSKRIAERWRNKSFEELSEEEKRQIRTKSIHSIYFNIKGDYKKNSSLFQIFERINTGSKNLNSQEIRNCIYQGDFNDLPKDLNNDVNWNSIILNEDKSPDKRMADIEIILRFFAIRDTNWNTFQKKSIILKQHLNDFMSKSFTNEDLVEMRQIFEGTCLYINENIINNKKISPTQMEAILIGVSLCIKQDENTQKRLDLNLITEDEIFKDSTTNRTTNTDNIIKRINTVTTKWFSINYESILQ